MNDQPPALLLKFPGTNCDAETARALQAAGFTTTVIPISLATPEHLKAASLVVFSGGFSYGDYVMAGRIAQLVTERKLGHALQEFVAGGGYVLGICNGFQILTKLGLLPEGSLIDNSSGRFQCRWVKLKNLQGDNPFLAELPDEFELPIAHAEGRFVASDGKAEEYLAKGLVTLQYTSDVNGSTLEIAGLQDETGRVFGLMPHPERFLFKSHHYDPDWNGDRDHGYGYYFFRSIWREISGGRKLLTAE
jgi:phosphoribosylformylglycinamidine synthase I